MPLPYDEYPYMPMYDVQRTRELDIPTFANEDEFSGGDMEDFYEYLLTPRHQMERSGQGAITRYGPSRFASVRPEDAEMAEFLMQQMKTQEEREFTESIRESELGRRRAADEMMMPQGRGGGSISFTGGAGEPSAETRFGSRGPGWEQGAANLQTMPVGGGMPEGPPPAPGPLDERGRAVLAGGSYGPESRVAAAEAQGEGYPGHGPKRMSGADRGRIGKVQNELKTLELNVMEIARRERGWEDLGFDKILERYATKPDTIPEGFRRELDLWAAKGQEFNFLVGGGGGGPGGPQEGDRRWR